MCERKSLLILLKEKFQPLTTYDSFLGKDYFFELNFILTTK